MATLFVLLFSAAHASASDTLTWNTNQNRVDADIQSMPVLRLLKDVARFTGWHVFIESNTTHTVSTKFQDLPPGPALRMLLGDLNFAIVPQTNGPQRLYVFRTSLENARIMIHPSDLVSTNAHSGPIPNELVVTLKPGMKIDGMDCLGDAKVTGRMDALNTYRVQFQDAAAAQASRDCLANNPNVLSVESNYSMEQPDLPFGIANAAPQFNLNPKANNGDCQVIIGLIDTHVASLGKDVDQFVMPAISVAGSATPGATLTHGTAMLGTIMQGLAANLHGGSASTPTPSKTSSGGSTSIKILPVDVYGPNETTSTFDVAEGIYQAVNSGANLINLSLGSSGDSAFLHTLIQNATSQGVTFFAAAGNQPVTTPTYPAAYPEVQAVTAGDGPGQVADYANRGSFVDLMLPGTSIVPFDGQSWAVTGTSTATAFATGIAAGLADSSHNCPGQEIPTIESKFGVTMAPAQ